MTHSKERPNKHFLQSQEFDKLINIQILCNAYFKLDFQITKTADSTNYAAENAVAVVNGAFSLFNSKWISMV